jgi:hypothetical protein
MSTALPMDRRIVTAPPIDLRLVTQYQDLAPSQRAIAEADAAAVLGRPPTPSEAIRLARLSSTNPETLVRVRRPGIPRRELDPAYREGNTFDPAKHAWTYLNDYVVREGQPVYLPLAEGFEAISDPDGDERELARREELMAGWKAWQAAEREREASRRQREEEERAAGARKAKALRHDQWFALTPQARALYQMALELEEGADLPRVLRSMAELVNRPGEAGLNPPNRPWWGS